jgi:hypothetical protein
MSAPCPYCGLDGGFHAIDYHIDIEIPREAIVQKGWQLDDDAADSRDPLPGVPGLVRDPAPAALP